MKEDCVDQHPSVKTALWRGWQRKCPHCGKGPIYRGWLKFQDQCPACGLRYLPDQGDLFGPLIFFDRVLFLIPFIVLFYFRLWHPNLFILLGTGAAMAFGLVYTMPHRNGLSLAFDYLMRRANGDLDLH
ncbi:MAG TPA: DUF983 domain-containing protein [Verrucomicrobiae bacterium]|nr:DUF983 domain-containing protein [Verrucomicrobiae bacterium]